MISKKKNGPKAQKSKCKRPQKLQKSIENNDYHNYKFNHAFKFQLFFIWLNMNLRFSFASWLGTDKI